MSAKSSTDADSGSPRVPGGLLEPACDPFFDTAAALAAAVTSSPVALLGFFDRDRQLIRGRYRWNVSYLNRDSAPGFQVLSTRSPVVVADALADERLRSNPLVVREPEIRFYAGVPVVGPDREIMGVLEVFDRVPREVFQGQIDGLLQIASGVSQYLAVRRREVELREQLADFGDVEQQLREGDERFREIFDSVDDLIMSIGPDGRLMHVNAASVSRLARDSRSLTGVSIFDLVDADSREMFRRQFDGIVKGGRPEGIETTLADAFGNKLVLEGTLAPRLIDGETVLLRVIFRDVTERKRTELELNRTRDAALEAARLKGQFLTNVSHEVRTPIHAIVGMLGLLSDSSLDGEQRDFVNSARTAADSLLQTINNILYASRLEAGGLTTSLSDFDIVGTAQRVVEVMRIAAEEKDLTLELDVSEGVPAIVRGEPGRYRQVLNNLIGNAIKFTSEGRIDVRLAIERETNTHTLVRLEVSDTGSGIPAEARPHIFSHFSQADGSASRSHDGIGLGLSIARQLVDLMGGAIGFDSEEGKGSTFWVTVPFERRESDAVAAAGTRVAFPGTRVLILDSSETNRRLVEHFVASWGMRHRVVNSAAETIQRAVTDAELGDPFHVLIAELHYPGIDVLELVERLASDPATSNVSAIVTVPLGEEVDDRQFRSMGVAAYLRRPVDRSDLFDSMTTALVKGPRSLAEIHDGSAGNDAVTAPAPEVSAEERASAAILLAEDKPLNQKLTLSQLRSLGYTADVAANGVEVIDALQKREYDVIFMDCQMPLMDGYETTKEVRRLQAGLRRTTIIAMTANALEGDREKCLAAGMDDYLSKPTRREELEGALARVLASAE